VLLHTPHIIITRPRNITASTSGKTGGSARGAGSWAAAPHACTAAVSADVRTVAGREQLEQLATLSSDYSLREKANRVLHLLATAPPEPGAELTSPRPFSNAFSNAFPNASVPPGARSTPFPALRDGTHAHHDARAGRADEALMASPLRNVSAKLRAAIWSGAVCFVGRVVCARGCPGLRPPRDAAAAAVCGVCRGARRTDAASHTPRNPPAPRTNHPLHPLHPLHPPALWAQPAGVCCRACRATRSRRGARSGGR
jgi:hypothetical protein